MALTGRMGDRTKGLILWTLAMLLVAIGLSWLAYLARDALLVIYVSVLLAIGFGPVVRTIERDPVKRDDRAAAVAGMGRCWPCRPPRFSRSSCRSSWTTATAPTNDRGPSSNAGMTHSMKLWLVVGALVVAPTVVYGWHDHHGEARRMRAEIRREWRDAVRDSRRAMAEARREMLRAGMERRRAIREAYREATRETRDSVRQAMREARHQVRDATRWYFR